MSAADQFQRVPIEEIRLDESNPRIATFLEQYEPPHNAAQIHMALGAGADDEGGGLPSFNRLKQSILTNGGIVNPVILRRLGTNDFVCIEGNTRVALYREFNEKGQDGSWDRIPAVVHDSLTDLEIHAIRLQAHLVGPRPWTPYAKAKYLTFLRHEAHFEFARLVDFCGGNERSIRESLDAFADMENYYRPKLEGDEEFETRKFSGFIELQKPGVKEAIAQGGFTLTDFAQWIIDDRIPKLAQVRALPTVLRDKKATAIFLKSGIEEALRATVAPDLSKALQDANLVPLARALTEAIRKIAHREVKTLKENPGSPAVQHLNEAHEALSELVTDISAE